MHRVYTTARWRRVRRLALDRDGNRCTVARLLGGNCSGPLHAHHLEPVADGGAPFDLDNVGTVCATHHPRWEKVRRLVLAEREVALPRCRHRHINAEARAICERQLARSRGIAA